jgi:hypothetical protein
LNANEVRENAHSLKRERSSFVLLATNSEKNNIIAANTIYTIYTHTHTHIHSKREREREKERRRERERIKTVSQFLYVGEFAV